MNWLLDALTHLPATFLVTVITIVLVGAAASLAGWSIGFEQGGSAGLGEREFVESSAFDRGVLAGERRERERQRAIRSAAGVKAHATRRNRVTGEVRTVPDATIGANTTGTSAPVTLTVYPGERDE